MASSSGPWNPAGVTAPTVPRFAPTVATRSADTTRGAGMRGEPVWVEGAWHSGAPNTPGLRRGPFLFVSGAVPIDLATGESVGTGIAEQTARVLDNIEAVLRAGGASMDDVVKVT